jgi:chromosome segregation ATPase
MLFAQIPTVLPSATTITNGTGIDINQIIQGSGGNPLMVVALGAVALLGGKTLWDFLKKRQEQAHEARMEEIKTMQTGHEACAAKQQALEDSLGALKNKIQDLDAKSSTAEKKVQEIERASEEKLEELRDKVSKLKRKVASEQTEDDAPKAKKKRV